MPAFRDAVVRCQGLGWRPRTSVAVVAVCLVVGALAQTHAGTNVARSIGLAAPEEPYTELYFTNPQMIATLTDTAQSQPSTAQVGFVIHNAGHVTGTYRWTVTLGSEVISGGTVTLAAGHFGFEVAKFRFCPHRAGRAREKARKVLRTVIAAVALLQPRQSIDARVVCDD